MHHCVCFLNFEMLHFNANPNTIGYLVNEEFGNAKNDMKQRNFNTVFANISKTTSPTSDSFLLIVSHILIPKMFHCHWATQNVIQTFPAPDSLPLPYFEVLQYPFPPFMRSSHVEKLHCLYNSNSVVK